MTYCQGTNADIIANTLCTIEITALRASPFDLPWGSHIYGKVLATNLVGSSAYSTVGNGAIILTTPDPPINLTELPPNLST